jgi:RNA-directed DNA polymerase
MGAVSRAIRKPISVDRAPSARKATAGNTLRLHETTMDVQCSKEFNRRTKVLAATKWSSLMGWIQLPSLEQAFRNVKRNRGAAGVDKVSILMFEANLEQNLQALLRRLQNGTFRPLPLRRVDIPKSPGKTRPIGIPAVRDRVVQEELRAILSIPFERIFHEDSYGFRPARSCHMAVQKVLESYRLGYKFVLDADISGFFDNLPHKVMMDGLTELIADGSILDLIERFLKAGVIKDGVFHSTRMGTPQGGVISPLLANIALNSLDWRLHNEGFRFVRYADDFVVLAQSEDQVKAAHELVQTHLQLIGLTLSPEKTRMTTFHEGFAFLGFDISDRSVAMRPKSVEKFKTRIRELTPRHHNLDQEVIRKVNAVVRGVANYFAAPFAHVVDLFRGLDRWIRMRIRCMKFKRKSRSDNRRLRLKHLKRLGLIDLLKPRAPPEVGTTNASHEALTTGSPGA